ncbi:MAG TPA: hypothetical protein VGN63_08180 [Flavisolibacter sp.]|nr:hypothetical protein [Flavisolibacter sp.]
MEERKDNSGERTGNMQVNSPAQSTPPGNSRLMPDAPTINDSRANVAKDNLSEGTAGTEINPEFGDAADPTSEKLGIGGRDDASPLTT